MTTPKSSKTSSPKKLENCRRQYARIKARIAEVGFLCEGSLVVRWIPCGKPTCACRADPTKRHGPYYQLSWKEKGKTISRRLDPEHARLYQQWLNNRQLLASILQEMYTVSRKACALLLPQFTQPTASPAQTRRHRQRRQSPRSKPRDITAPRR